MSDQFRDQIFQAEFGQYFQSVSAASPVGVCSKCLAMRARQEVDPQEKCPADLLQSGMSDISSAQPHDWIGFTESDPLKEFVQQNIARFRQIVEQAAERVHIQPEED